MSLRSFASFATFAVATSVALLPMKSASAGGPSARDIMAKNEDARTIRELLMSSTLTVTGSGEQKVKTFTTWRKLGSDNIHYRMLTRFHTPAEVRNEGILFEEKAGGENDIRMYLPRMKKVRRVEAQSQRTSFMGSSFSYSDMTTQHYTDYRHNLLRNEPCPQDTKVNCFVVESQPETQGIKDRTGYSRSVQWVRSDNYHLSQGEFYDLQGALWKRIVATDFREVDAAAHKSIAFHTRVEDLKGSKQSTMQVNQAQANSGIPESTFTQQNLATE